MIVPGTTFCFVSGPDGEPSGSRAENASKLTRALAPEACYLHSSPRILPSFATAFAAAVLLAVLLPASAQYPGQVTRKAKDNPELRAIAVLEWTGVPGKPNASRLVPVAVLDGGQLQDGSIYLARPEPMSVAGEVEYELQQDGKPLGLYDIKNAGQEQGSWVGYGTWRPLPVAKPKPSMAEVARSTVNEEDSDRPTLHRKKHAGDETGAGSTGSKGDDSSEPSAPSDPDRPKLHKKDSGSQDSGAQDSGGGAASDPDRPTLHKKTESDDSASSGASAPEDPDRPKLKKGKSKSLEDIGHEEALPGVTDPDRPTLKRGKSSGNNLDVLPSLMGIPAEMQQAVAVSDAKSRPEHPWSYSWANPDDEAKMKSALEDMARAALGIKPPPAPPAPAPKRTPTHKSAKPTPPPPPPTPAPLEGEEFRAFELAYGSGATLVLSAHTSGPFAKQKFVTFIAQPDLYGNVLVLFMSVSDGDHLDDNPRLRLVDAVDAMADNRGELLFELRGNTQRQFALYRVLRGRAEKIFMGGGGSYGIEDRN